MSRRERIEKLYRILSQVNAEIAVIEAELRDELAATSRAKTQAAKASARTRNRKIAQCGTPTGYYRHRRTLSEPACDACKLAHNLAEAERVARKKATA